jgi:cytochrome c oxidase subunit I+III
MNVALTAQIVLAIALMVPFAIARYLTGALDHVRRVTFESTALLICYAAAQGLFGLLLIHLFPRAVG